MDYIGAAIGGAISGAAISFGGAILLGGLGSFAETFISGELTLSTFFSSPLEGMVSGALVYGVFFLEFGGGKVLSKLFGNNKINHFFKSLGVDNVKVGMKNLTKSVKNLANASNNYIAAFFGAVADGVITWLEKRFATQTA